jgi:hypothetical protein
VLCQKECSCHKHEKVKHDRLQCVQNILINARKSEKERGEWRERLLRHRSLYSAATSVEFCGVMCSIARAQMCV